MMIYYAKMFIDFLRVCHVMLLSRKLVSRVTRRHAIFLFSGHAIAVPAMFVVAGRIRSHKLGHNSTSAAVKKNA